MSSDKDVHERAIINRVKCLAAMLHPTSDFLPNQPKITADARLFAIHQEIDQYLFGGDGNLTYVGKFLTLKEKENVQ